MSHSSYHISPFSYDEASGTMDSGYPRSIENDFPGMGDEVDAAVYHYGTKLLFSVTQFQSQVNFLSSNFIVGFFFLPGFLYFFHDQTQYEYSYTSRKVLRILKTNFILGC